MTFIPSFFRRAARRLSGVSPRCDVRQCLAVSGLCLAAFVAAGLQSSGAAPARVTMNGVRIANGFPTATPPVDPTPPNPNLTPTSGTPAPTPGGTPMPTPPVDKTRPTPPPPVVTATPPPAPTATPAATQPPSTNWSPTDKEIGYNRVDEGWQADGRLIAPIDQRAEGATKEKVVAAGAEVKCEVETAHDFDAKTRTTPATPATATTPAIPEKSETTYEEDGPLTYQWTADKGTFEGATNGQTVNWKAPLEPGRYTIKCTIDDPPGPRVKEPLTGSHDDAALTRSCEVIVPKIEITFKQETLAIGSKDDDAHKAKFEVKVTDDKGAPVKDFTIPKPTIVKDTGRDAHDGTSAEVTAENLVTDDSGIVKGTLKSGNRLETTKIHIQTDPNDAESGPSAGAEQVWSDLGDDAWDYEEYFEYGEALTIKYRMAYTRDDVEESITGHTMEPETITLKGYEWNPDAGEDEDEDGLPDGDYEEQTYDKDSDGYDQWKSLVTWGKVSEDDGTYSVDQTIDYDEDFELDSVTFDLADTDSYGADGSLE